MSCFNFIMRKLGFYRDYRLSELEEAMSENVRYDAAQVFRAADNMIAVAHSSRISNSKLMDVLRSEPVKPFADLEHLIHHGERRSA